MNKYTNVSKSILHLKHNMTQHDRKKHEHKMNTRINRFTHDIICNKKYHDEIRKKKKKISDYEAFYLIKIS